VLIGQDLYNRRIIQRTGAGTQGLVRSVKAETLLASSFVCAGATARYIKQQLSPTVTLVNTGPDGEDAACAGYIAALLRGETVETAPLLSRVRDIGLQHIQKAMAESFFSEAEQFVFTNDLACCIDLDRFDFVMQVRRRDGLLVMERTP
jgi:2-phosphosulfolactate phosphatase